MVLGCFGRCDASRSIKIARLLRHGNINYSCVSQGCFGGTDLLILWMVTYGLKAKGLEKDRL
jgi:hypothetical protein